MKLERGGSQVRFFFALPVKSKFTCISLLFIIKNCSTVARYNKSYKIGMIRSLDTCILESCGHVNHITRIIQPVKIRSWAHVYT